MKWGTKIELFEGGKVTRTIEPNVCNQRWTLEWITAPRDAYFFVKATETDGDILWSAPIWVEKLIEIPFSIPWPS